MQSHRFRVERMTIDGVAVDAGYADLFVVVRDGARVPAPTDWEAQASGTSRRILKPGRHALGFDIADGTHMHGEAIVRFSNGTRHLFRGDSHLRGFTPYEPEPDAGSDTPTDPDAAP